MRCPPSPSGIPQPAPALGGGPQPLLSGWWDKGLRDGLGGPALWVMETSISASRDAQKPKIRALLHAAGRWMIPCLLLEPGTGHGHSSWCLLAPSASPGWSWGKAEPAPCGMWQHHLHPRCHIQLRHRWPCRQAPCVLYQRTGNTKKCQPRGKMLPPSKKKKGRH